MLILIPRLDSQFPVEQCKAAGSQSALPSLPPVDGGVSAASCHIFRGEPLIIIIITIIVIIIIIIIIITIIHLSTANPQTKSLDFGGVWLEQALVCEGCISPE